MQLFQVVIYEYFMLRPGFKCSVIFSITSEELCAGPKSDSSGTRTTEQDPFSMSLALYCPLFQELNCDSPVTIIASPDSVPCSAAPEGATSSP